MVALREQKHIGETLARLAASLESLEFGPDSALLAGERDRLAGTIRCYLLPRTLAPTGPLTVVVAGPTGSGKSTLVNSLAGVDVSRTGALRPTTRSPVAVCGPGHPGDYQTFGGADCRVVRADAPILESIVLIDTPDIDSTSAHHRATAERLIDSADVVVFVTSALRYADEVPWQVLRRAISRGAPVIHVLNRVGSASAGAIVDFGSRLTEAGVDGELLTIPEHHLRVGAHQVPALAVQSLRRRLGAIVGDRDRFADEVMRDVLASTITATIALADAVGSIQDEIDALEAELEVDLAGHVPALPLAGIGTDLYPPAPMGTSPMAQRRWKKKSRTEVTRSIAEAEHRVVERVVASVNSAARRWLVEARELLAELGVAAGPVISGVAAGASSAVEGWIAYVARIAADFDESEASLGEAVLIDAATSPEPRPAVAILFGDEGPVLVDRARRELQGRLDVVFELAARLVVEGRRQRLGDLDDADLRAMLGAVTSALASVYA